jgi:hypothetical protein
MDPNATLEEMRRLAARLVGAECCEDATCHEDAERLGELVQAMDEWLCNGGSMPDEWGVRGKVVIK